MVGEAVAARGLRLSAATRPGRGGCAGHEQPPPAVALVARHARADGRSSSRDSSVASCDAESSRGIFGPACRQCTLIRSSTCPVAPAGSTAARRSRSGAAERGDQADRVERDGYQLPAVGGPHGGHGEHPDRPLDPGDGTELPVGDLQPCGGRRCASCAGPRPRTRPRASASTATGRPPDRRRRRACAPARHAGRRARPTSDAGVWSASAATAALEAERARAALVHVLGNTARLQRSGFEWVSRKLVFRRDAGCGPNPDPMVQARRGATACDRTPRLA
jgi:hypothetical protein